MKKIQAVILILGMLIAKCSFAGIPVFDGANLLEAVQEVLSWEQQYTQMIQSIEQYKSQLTALTGARNLGQILDNPALRGVVPTDVISVYNDIEHGGSSGLTAAAKTIRNDYKIYDCENRTGQSATQCQATLNVNAQHQANTQNALSLAQQRTDQITSLEQQINSTSDPKGIAELQARIAVEQTQVVNDANRVALMNASAAQQDAQISQQARETTLANLAKASDGSDMGDYLPPL